MELNYNRLIGEIPAELDSLSNLTELYLSPNPPKDGLGTALEEARGCTGQGPAIPSSAGQVGAEAIRPAPPDPNQSGPAGAVEASRIRGPAAQGPRDPNHPPGPPGVYGLRWYPNSA